MSEQKRLRIGIHLPTRGILLEGSRGEGPSSIFALAEQAEQAGLDSVWVGDSLMAKPRLEPLTVLAAVAMRTRRVRLGTAVLLAPLRQPPLLAQMATTVDILSQGRLTLGMGVGGIFTPAQQQEWRSAGVPPTERGGRMSELVQVLQRLWTEDAVTFHGRYFNLEEASLKPRPVQAGGIPLLLACHYATGSDAQYRRAGRYGSGVMGISDQPEEYRQVLERVRGHAREAGRDPGTLQTAFYMTINLNADADKAFADGDQFIRQYYGLNFWKDKWGPFGQPRDVAQRMLEYARAGAQEIVVRFASFDPFGQLATFVREVVPLVLQGAWRTAPKQD